MTETTTIEDLARKVAILRTAYAVHKDNLDRAYAAWKAENAAAHETLEGLVAELTQVEKDLRAAGFAEFQATGAKKLPCGLGVRVSTKPDYDPAEALTWAKHHGLALQLDKAAFERIVKADTPDFVKMVEVPTVTLPSDSAKLLGEG